MSKSYVGMGMCFWCGKANSVVIDKRLKDSFEPSQLVFTGYEPCDKCKNNMDLGLSVIKCVEKPNKKGQPEIQKGIYPTGRWWVINRDSEFAKSMSKGMDKIFIDNEAVRKIGLYGEKNETKLETV